jgi:hypothetical protein
VSAAVAYHRAPHAAHSTPPGASEPTGWDLESWSAPGTPRDPRPEGVPIDAEYHSGYVESGVQHAVYVRRAPLSPGYCERCLRSVKSGAA